MCAKLNCTAWKIKGNYSARKENYTMWEKNLHKEVKTARHGKYVGKYEIIVSCFSLFKSIYWLAKAKIITMYMGL